jgi:hypothetical protein
VTFGHREVDLFFVFSSGILGETKPNKSAKVAIFTEFVLGNCQKKNKAGFYEISIFPSCLQPIFTKL